MEILQTEENEETKDENNENGQENPSDDNQNSDNDDKKDENKDEETETKLDSDYDIDEYKLDEQLVDTDSNKQSNEQVIQKKNLNNLNIDYKIFTTEFDEIEKAENLENISETIKLRKTLDQQLIGFRM